jgi:hypothetical protein
MPSLLTIQEIKEKVKEDPSEYQYMALENAFCPVPLFDALYLLYMLCTVSVCSTVCSTVN